MQMTWIEIKGHIDSMSETLQTLKKKQDLIPSNLSHWVTFTQISQEIDNIDMILRLVHALAKKSIKARHWNNVQETIKTTIQFDDENLTLTQLLETKALLFLEEIEEISFSADK